MKHVPLTPSARTVILSRRRHVHFRHLRALLRPRETWGNKEGGTKMTRTRWAAALGGFFVIVGFAAPVFASDCSQIDIPSARSTTAAGISSKGDIAGQFTDGKNVTHGFFIDHRDGQVSVIDVPGSTRTTAIGINSEGDIVGRYDDSAGAHGYLLKDGVFTTLQFPGSTFSAGLGVSAPGDVVGIYRVGKESHAYTFIDGAYASVDVPGATGTSGAGIDDAGDVCGNYVTSDGVTHGFMLRREYSGGPFDPCGKGGGGGVALSRHMEGRDDGDVAYNCERPAPITVDVPGAVFTYVRGITRHGRLAVGSYSMDPTLAVTHGFKYELGVLTRFDYPGAATTTLLGVNHSGHFVGDFNTDGGTLFHGYVCR